MSITSIEKFKNKVCELSRKKTDGSEENLILKCLSNPSSSERAIDAFCFGCVGGTINQLPAPGWRELIRTCTSPGCLFYLHRPYR